MTLTVLSVKNYLFEYKCNFKYKFFFVNIIEIFNLSKQLIKTIECSVRKKISIVPINNLHNCLFVGGTKEMFILQTTMCLFNVTITCISPSQEEIARPFSRSIYTVSNG